MDKLIRDDERVFNWISERSGLCRVADFIGIAREVDGVIKSAFGYDHHQGLSCFMHVASEPGGLTRNLIRRVYWVAHVQWGYNLTMGVIQASNLQSRQVAARLGYAEMLVIPGAHPSGALHLVGMYKNNCPWLLENKNHERRFQRTLGPEPDGEHPEPEQHLGVRH